jgi:hypothetical protein
VSYWAAKTRCQNPNHRAFSWYGGREIEFCFDSYEQFFNAVGRRPPGMWLDRPDNDRSYQSNNVCWATPKEQARNRRPQKRGLRIKLGDPTIEAGLRRLNESLARARGLAP